MRIFAILLLSSLALIAQPAKPREFEAAEIKPSDGRAADPGKGRIIGGTVELPGVTLRRLIQEAYAVQPDMIFGGPSWIDNDLFDLVAKASPDVRLEDLRAMFQSLLAGKFRLVIHREDRPKSIYVLVVGKSGPKLKPASGARQSCRWNNLPDGQIERACLNTTIQELATDLPDWGRARVDLPVMDLTGIRGAWDFELHWSLEKTADVADPPVIGAMPQIGLKMESRKMPVSVVVIDHVERLAAK
jgi:uncharacterized protein (TIGR03435 family)